MPNSGWTYTHEISEDELILWFAASRSWELPVHIQTIKVVIPKEFNNTLIYKESNGQFSIYSL